MIAGSKRTVYNLNDRQTFVCRRNQNVRIHTITYTNDYISCFVRIQTIDQSLAVRFLFNNRRISRNVSTCCHLRLGGNRRFTARNCYDYDQNHT